MPSSIEDRKLWQWTVAYVAGAWVVLEATGEISDLLLWPRTVQLVVLVLLLFGLPTAVVIAWYHGEKGAQRVTRTELILISLITVTGVSTAYAVARATPAALDPLEPVSGRLGEALEPTRYAVFPFRGEEAEDVPALGLLLRDAMGRWEGIELVDPALVEDALDPRAPAIEYVEDARNRSSRNRAGRLVLGEVARAGDGLRVRMEVRDTRSGRVLADTTVQLPLPGVGADSAIAAAADGLLFRAEGLPAPEAGGPGTTSFPARVAFLEGMDELNRWRLDEAIRRFEEAGHLDPGYARAHLWRAQAMSWGGRSGPEVLGLAERAASSASGLTERERYLATGLLSLERGEFEQACESYGELREIDARDFAAWFGLGECRYLDNRVVPDPSSPTGWGFQASHHQAVEAYRRAFELLPSRFRGFSSVVSEIARGSLYTRPTKARVGQALGAEGELFAAFPTLAGDTLAFVPSPLEAFNRGETPGASPRSHWSAVERQRRVLRDLSAGWLAAFPDDAEALRAYALTLDLLGDPATLDTLARARAVAAEPGLERRLAMESVPRMIKYGIPDDLGQLRRARALADSLLAEADRLPPSAELAAIAAMVGRVFIAAGMQGATAEPIRFPVDIPALVNAPAEALLAYAAMGGPADSIAHYERRVVEAVENRIPPGEHALALESLLVRSALLAAPSSPLALTRSLSEKAHGPAVVQAIGLVVEGRMDEARSLAPALATDAPESRPADRTPDVLLPNVWLAVQLGDTTEAIRALDGTLNALRWLEPRAMEQVVMAGALVRSMALRADLAHARGDAATAARWARAVAVLWDDADPPLQPLVSRMWTLARTPDADRDELDSTSQP